MTSVLLGAAILGLPGIVTFVFLHLSSRDPIPHWASSLLAAGSVLDYGSFGAFGGALLVRLWNSPAGKRLFLAITGAMAAVILLYVGFALFIDLGAPETGSRRNAPVNPVLIPVFQIITPLVGFAIGLLLHLLISRSSRTPVVND
jgi:ABC-type tungstate transport system substrate-binding protein